MRNAISACAASFRKAARVTDAVYDSGYNSSARF